MIFSPEPAWRSFLLRVRSQFEQLHRFFVSTAERFVQSLEMLLRGQLRPSAVLRQLFGPAGSKGQEPMERDYFNLRKVIVVSTFAGGTNDRSFDLSVPNFSVKNRLGHRGISSPVPDFFGPYPRSRRARPRPIFHPRPRSDHPRKSSSTIFDKSSRVHCQILIRKKYQSKKKDLIIPYLLVVESIDLLREIKV